MKSKITKIFIKEPNTFLESVKPVSCFNWIVGMSFYLQSDLNDSALYLCMKLYTIIAMLYQWSMTYIGFTAMRDSYKDFPETEPAAMLMYLVLVYTNSCIAVSAPFLVWFQNKGLQDCVQRMQILDDTFQANFGARNEYKKQYIRLISKVSTIILVMAIVSICDSPWIMAAELSLLKTYAITVTLHHPIVVMLVLDLNFCCCIGYLRKKFQDMNDSLIKFTKKSSASYHGKKIFINSRKVTPGHRITNINAELSSINDNLYLMLYEIRKAHLELCKMSRQINLVFGIQNLLSVGISFAMVTGMLYTIYSAVILDDFTADVLKHIIPSVVWTIVYAFKMWVVNHSCWTVSREADRTGEVIYDLLESRVNKELQKEIQEFGVQLLQNPVRFDACGFFVLGYTFLQGVIGSITTHLVILIQMSHITKSSTTDTALARNNTKMSANN